MWEELRRRIAKVIWPEGQRYLESIGCANAVLRDELQNERERNRSLNQENYDLIRQFERMERDKDVYSGRR